MSSHSQSRAIERSNRFVTKTGGKAGVWPGWNRFPQTECEHSRSHKIIFMQPFLCSVASIPSPSSIGKPRYPVINALYVFHHRGHPLLLLEKDRKDTSHNHNLITFPPWKKGKNWRRKYFFLFFSSFDDELHETYSSDSRGFLVHPPTLNRFDLIRGCSSCKDPPIIQVH